MGRPGCILDCDQVRCREWVGWMAEPVRARRLTDDEDRRLQQIVRRGKHESGWVARALIIMASASGTPVPAIARLVAAHEDTVRDVIHRLSLIFRFLQPVADRAGRRRSVGYVAAECGGGCGSGGGDPAQEREQGGGAAKRCHAGDADEGESPLGQALVGCGG